LVSGLESAKAQGLECLKVMAPVLVPGWETDSELAPELEPAPDWGVALGLAVGRVLGSDSAQALVDLVAPVRLREPALSSPDLKLRFLLPTVCVGVNDAFVQRCVQA
jgi:hypothetical protein